MKIFKRRKSPYYWATHTVGDKRYRCSLKTSDRREARRRANRWVEKLEAQIVGPRQTVTLSHAITTYLCHCGQDGQEDGLARSTVRIYRSRLTRFLEFVGDVDISTWTEDNALDLVSDHLDHRVRSGEVTSPQEDRLSLSAFFSFLKAKRWYRGENPSTAALHKLRKPRRRRRQPRSTTVDEDMIIRREGAKTVVWPVLLLARWAGMRRGEACALRWKHVNFTDGYADVVGEEGGRKHPRRVWLRSWIILQLRAIKAHQRPPSDDCTVWPFHPDTATDHWGSFREAHLTRRIIFNDLRASWVTQVHDRGMTALEESKIGGHSPAVAERYYSDYTARMARSKLPPDPLFGDDGDTCDDAQVTLRSHSEPEKKKAGS